MIAEYERKKKERIKEEALKKKQDGVSEEAEAEVEEEPKYRSRSPSPDAPVKIEEIPR